MKERQVHQLPGVTWGYLGSLVVKFQIFQNLDILYAKMKLFVPLLRKSGSWDQLIPNWGDLGSLGAKI